MDNSAPKNFFLKCIYVVVLLGVLGFAVMEFSGRQAPWSVWLKHHAQRKFVFTNVEAAGGWNAFKSECVSLISIAKASGQYTWFLRGSHPWPAELPTSCKIISGLRPHSVEVETPLGGPAYVIIEIFGDHSKGKPPTPYYGLVYQTLTNSDECVAASSFQSSTPRKITDQVFEIY
jgi:hypothetical protein